MRVGRFVSYQRDHRCRDPSVRMYWGRQGKREKLAEEESAWVSPVHFRRGVEEWYHWERVMCDEQDLANDFRFPTWQE